MPWPSSPTSASNQTTVASFDVSDQTSTTFTVFYFTTEALRFGKILASPVTSEAQQFTSATMEVSANSKGATRPTNKRSCFDAYAICVVQVELINAFAN